MGSTSHHQKGSNNRCSLKLYVYIIHLPFDPYHEKERTKSSCNSQQMIFCPVHGQHIILREWIELLVIHYRRVRCPWYCSAAQDPIFGLTRGSKKCECSCSEACRLQTFTFFFLKKLGRSKSSLYLFQSEPKSLVIRSLS